jgi:hypothetical protein
MLATIICVERLVKRVVFSVGIQIIKVYRNIHFMSSYRKSKAVPKFHNGVVNHLSGQGATEYLVLLAVVLIVALVAISFLGGFPGISSEALFKQSNAYWSGAGPVSVVAGGAVYSTSQTQVEGAAFSDSYIIIRNNEPYKIIITGLQASKNSDKVTTSSISIGPGGEVCVGSGDYSAQPNCDSASIFPGILSKQKTNALFADSNCNSDGTGYVTLNDFQIYYDQYLEDSMIQKKFTGSKPLMLKCMGTGVIGGFNSVCDPGDPHSCRSGLNCIQDASATYYCLTTICYGDWDCTPPSYCVDAGDPSYWAYCTPS